MNNVENEEDTLKNSQGELRCVLAIIRHGDRTPKQKIKMAVQQVKIP